MPRLSGFLVERVLRLHVVAHVRDRDHQAKSRATASCRQRLAVDGVVEILRGFAVDGHERQRREIGAVLAVLVCDLIGEPLAQTFRLGREHVRQRVLAQGDLDLHAGIGVIAEHFHDARDRLGMLRRLRDDFRHHDLPRPRAAGFAGWHQELVADAAVLRHDKQDAVLLAQAPDHPLMRVLQHFDDLALGSAAPVGAGDARDDSIAVQHLVHFARAEEKIRAAVVAHQEPESVRMPVDAPAYEIGFFGDADRVTAIADDIAVALHRREPARERHRAGAA